MHFACGQDLYVSQDFQQQNMEKIFSLGQGKFWLTLQSQSVLETD